MAIPEPVSGWDRAITGGLTRPMYLTHEELAEGDWTKSGAGSAELDFLRAEMTVFTTGTLVPCLAESWEIQDQFNATINIRPGVTWQNKPPMNGRELTAEDVAFSIDRWWHLDTAYAAAYFDEASGMRPTDVKAVDKYTVTFKIPAGKMNSMIPNVLDWNFQWPKDSIELYGDQTDWKNSGGTGPFIITDVVPGSAYTMDRNPNYWRKHPLYPEDTMPYLDTVKFLVIEDLSTQLAALRTGKIDWIQEVKIEDAESLALTNPELQFKRYMPANWPTMVMRIDNPDVPYYDKNVRHALQLAVNREEIKNDLYKGEASIYEWPVFSYGAFKRARTEMEDLPASTQDLFKYNPTKAKELLAEAGYPNGFKTSVVARASDVDMLSIISQYWAAIGVDLEIDVKEIGVYRSILSGRNHDEMIMHNRGGTQIQTLDCWNPKGYQNLSFIDTPETTEIFDTVYTDWLDFDTIGTAWQKFGPYILDMADVIVPPVSYVRTLWQPWVRDYNGEWTVGHWDYFEFAKYVWLDQDIKEEMTGRR